MIAENKNERIRLLSDHMNDAGSAYKIFLYRQNGGQTHRICRLNILMLTF